MISPQLPARRAYSSERGVEFTIDSEWNIGMLEYWNIGKMGFGILECWVNGIIVLTIKLKTDDILKITHYSIFP